MLANNNKSVAVSGGHIPSYNSNRWAILTGPSCLCPSVPSVNPSVLSVSCLSNSTPVSPPQTSLPAVFFIPHNICNSVQMLQSSVEPCSPLVFVSSVVFLFFLPFYSHVLIPEWLQPFRWHNVPSGGRLKALHHTVYTGNLISFPDRSLFDSKLSQFLISSWLFNLQLVMINFIFVTARPLTHCRLYSTDIYLYRHRKISSFLIYRLDLLFLCSPFQVLVCRLPVFSQ